MMNGGHLITLAYVVFGLYVINEAFKFVPLDFLQNIHVYVLAIAGGLLVISGFSHLRNSMGMMGGGGTY